MVSTWAICRGRQLQDPTHRLLAAFAKRFLTCEGRKEADLTETPSLHVLTPAYGGTVALNYHDSLLKLQRHSLEEGIVIQHDYVLTDSLVPRARNTLVHTFMTQSKASHALLIDSDIGFEPEAITAMLELQAPIVAAPYPKKKIRWDRVFRGLKDGMDPEACAPLAAGETVCLPHLKAADVNPCFNGVGLQRDFAGAGLMLIEAGVFAKLTEAYPHRWYLPTQDVEADGSKFWDFFPCGIVCGDNEPQYESEDYGFCRLCSMAGIQILMLPWLRTTHYGNHLYIGDVPAVARLCGEL